MKKIVTLMMLILLSTVVRGQKQLRVLPKFNVGDRYVCETLAIGDGVALTTTNISMEFYVSQKTPGGYVVDMTITALTSVSENMRAALMAQSSAEMLKDVKVRLAVDNNGQISRIVNFEEVKQQCVSNISRLCTQLYEYSPELKKAITLNDYIQKTVATVREQAIIADITQNHANPFSIFGKTIIDGATETSTDEWGLRTKYTYHVLGDNKFSQTGELDMTKEEIKAYLYKIFDSSNTDEAREAKKEVEKLTNMGVKLVNTQFESIYELTNGWINAHEMTRVIKIADRTIEASCFENLATSKAAGDEVYRIVDILPSFPNGPAALFKYLSSAIKYPVFCEENGIEGRVICSFIVEKDGSISAVEVIKSADKSLDLEAARVVRNMPKWNPGKKDGKVVRVKYAVPVTFKIVDR